MNSFFKTNGGILFSALLFVLGVVGICIGLSMSFSTPSFLIAFFGLYVALIGVERFNITWKLRKERKEEQRQEADRLEALPD